MKNLKSLYTLGLAGLLLTGFSNCTTNAVTGRSQLSLVSDATMQNMGAQQYTQFLTENKTKVVTNPANKDAAMVKRVGTRIANAITRYYASKGESSALANYKWEFNLIENSEPNAWCMPGGKVVVYTGLLPITQDEASLAIVLGHEITHAVAGHGKEQYSQKLVAAGLQEVGGVALSSNPTAKTLFNTLYAPTAGVSMLSFSRRDEFEADHYGLIFAAMAGYNPQVAVGFWQRMTKLAGSSSTPTLLSSHPSNAARIEAIQQLLPEAMKYYAPVK